ncbi:CDP-glycerol glycerophosphotransferase family protein [Pseudoxanthomonas sp. NC8]|nr:CDP-glycerol glycerophosphotransferase family protein [Pseudoxanthomonas sp. NC8]
MLPAAGNDDDPARRDALAARLHDYALDPELHFELGLCCERLGLHAEAAAAYAAGLDRHAAHAPRWHFRLAVALHRAGRDRDACDAFLTTRLFRRDFDIVPEAPVVEGQPAPVRDIKLEYAEFIETLPVRDEVVLYESFHGDSVSCNPLAVFRAARATGQPRPAARVGGQAGRDHPRRPGRAAGRCVRAPRQHRVRPLPYHRRLAGQQQHLHAVFRAAPGAALPHTLWHGTPLKKLGIDIPGALFDHKNALRNLLQATHLAMPNAFTRQVLLSSMQVEDVITARIADTGQARIDLMLGADAGSRTRLKARLGLTADAKVILYAPTWRGSLDGASLDTGLVSEAIGRLAGHGASVLFSGHHMVARALGPLPDGAMAIPAGEDITELMSVVDVLVTDYSSILFDFLPSGRPVLLYVPDPEQYRRERGLYLDIHALPVHACATPEALEQALPAALAATPGENLAGDTARIEAARREYWPLEDGASAARIVAFFFEDDTRHMVSRPPRSKRTLLFHSRQLQSQRGDRFVQPPRRFNRSGTRLDDRGGRSVDPRKLSAAPRALRRTARPRGTLGPDQLPGGHPRTAVAQCPPGRPRGAQPAPAAPARHLLRA